MYRFFKKIKNKITYFLYKLIEKIEKYELRYKDLDQNDTSKKILYSIKTNNLKVKTSGQIIIKCRQLILPAKDLNSHPNI
jgi:hypothetical protein